MDKLKAAEYLENLNGDKNMVTSYEVRIAHYAKAGRIIIQFCNESDVSKLKTCYVKVWGKGTRLYFMPASPTNGKKISDSHQIQYEAKDMVESLAKYQGEYTTLLYDSVTHYYYIDSEHKMETTVNEGSRTGEKRTYTRKVKSEIKEEVKAEPIIKEVVKEIKAPENDIKVKIDKLVFEYVKAGDITKAQVAVEICERLCL